MRYAIIEGNKVVNIVEADSVFAKEQGWIDATGGKIGDLWDGEKFTTPTKPFEEAQFVEEVRVATQARLDAFAQTRNYDGVLSACTYATSAVLKFKTEGQYCVNARDTTWASVYQIMVEVKEGTRPMPGSVAEVMDLLPGLSWPA